MQSLRPTKAGIRHTILEQEPYQHRASGGYCVQSQGPGAQGHSTRRMRPCRRRPHAGTAGQRPRSRAQERPVPLPRRWRASKDGKHGPGRLRARFPLDSRACQLGLRSRNQGRRKARGPGGRMQARQDKDHEPGRESARFPSHLPQRDGTSPSVESKQIRKNMGPGAHTRPVRSRLEGMTMSVARKHSSATKQPTGPGARKRPVPSRREGLPRDARRAKPGHLEKGRPTPEPPEVSAGG
jgi:hypothetical protein